MQLAGRGLFTVFGVSLCALVLFASVVQAQTIQVWIGSATEQAFLERVYLPKFKEKNPGVEVEFLQVGLQEVFDRLVAGVVTGAGPDVIATGNTTVFNLSNVGLLTPIDKYLETWEGYPYVWPAAWSNQRFNGVTYGIPMYSAARGIYYRTDAVEEVGLDPAIPPQSWSEILEWVQRLNRVEADRLVRAGYDLQGNHYQEWVFWLNQAGGVLISEDLRTPLFNSEAGVEAIDQMLKLAEQARFIDLGPPSARSANGLVSNTVGLVIGHSGLISNILSADPAVASVTRVFAPRKDPGSRPVALTFTDGWAIPATSKNPEIAWKFLEGMLDREIAAAFINEMGRIVPRSDLMPLIEHEHFIPGYQLLEYFFPYPTLPEGAWLSTSFSTEFARILRGEQSPRAVLEQLESAFAPRVREYWDSVVRN